MFMADDARIIFPAGRWVEKTPNSDMIHLAPRLEKDVAEQPVHLHEAPVSRKSPIAELRKFPKYDFERNCQGVEHWPWRRGIAVRGRSCRSAIEIDQDYLSTKPEEVASALREFLDLTEMEGKRLGQALKNDRPERTSELTDHHVDLDGMRWTEPQIEEFKRTCLKWMDAFGYSTDGAYFKPGSENQRLVLV